MTTTTTKRITGAASGGQTKRVAGAASGGRTNRVAPRHLLLLEGDESGYLLLEGDAQSGTDALELEGDVPAFGGSQTKRVTLT